MKYLVRTTEVYRIDTENEAKAFIESQKERAENYVVSKYSSEYKEKKTKGEVIDSWFRVTIVKDFNDEKEPDYEVTISYEV
jgi:hypothetical protein